MFEIKDCFLVVYGSNKDYAVEYSRDISRLNIDTYHVYDRREFLPAYWNPFRVNIIIFQGKYIPS